MEREVICERHNDKNRSGKCHSVTDQEQENLCDKCRVGIIIYAENVEVRFPKKTWEVEKFSTHNFLQFFVTIVT